MTAPSLHKTAPSGRGAELARALDDARLAHDHLLITGPGTHDIIVTGDGRSRRLTAFLHGYCQDRGIGYVRYSLASGISTWGTLPQSEAVRVTPCAPATHPAQAIEQAIADLRSCGREALLAFDWADTVLTAGRDLSLDLLGLCERIQALAADHEWHQAGMRLVVIDRCGTLTPRLAQQPGIRAHHLGAPDQKERSSFVVLALKSTHSAPISLEPGLDADQLGRLAGGLFNLDLQRMRRTSCPERPLTAARVAREKAEAIRQASGGTLELMPAGVSFAADVAGLPAVQHAVQAALRAGRGGLYMMLAGPAGTGKSLSAAAIATALNLPIVRYGQILNEYVGVAERNIALANDLLRAMAPLVLFLDEVDQKGFGKRGASARDNQVHQNLRAAMFEFLGDGPEKTGISVVATTNVPAQLDDAAASRFPVIPVLFASGTELAQITAIQARIQRVPIGEDLTEVLTGYVEAGGVLSGRTVPGVLAKAWDNALQAGRAGAPTCANWRMLLDVPGDVRIPC